MRFYNLIALVLINIILLCLNGCDRNTDSNSGGSTNSYTLTTISHPATPDSIYNFYVDGPRYQAFKLTNNSTTALSLSSLSISNSAPNNGPLSIVSSSATNVYGSNSPCIANSTILAQNQSCYIFLSADPSYAQLFQQGGGFTQNLSITTNFGTRTASINSQGYLYFGGDFNQLGQASISTGSFLLAKCSFATANNANLLTCTNAIPGSTAGANNSIYAIATDNAGNIYTTGSFTSFNGVSSPAFTSLVAKLNPASNNNVSDAFNGNGDPASYNPGAVNATTSAIIFDSTTNMAYLTGFMATAGGATVTTPAAGILLMARCDLSLSSNQCTNALGNNDPNYIFPNNNSGSLAIYNNSNYLLGGGQMSQIQGQAVNFSFSCPLSNGIATSCSNIVASGSVPNSIVYTLLVSGNNLYIGGTFSTIGTFNPGGTSSTVQVLAACTLDSGTGLASCANNALGTPHVYVENGIGGSSTTVRGTALDNAGNIFLAGKFGDIRDVDNGTILANTSSVNAINLIGRCVVGGSNCSNLLTGVSPDGANQEINAMTANVEITQVTIN